MQTNKATSALFLYFLVSLCVFPSNGKAQIFPDMQLVKIEELFPEGASATELYDFLESKRFIIAEKKEGVWRRSDGTRSPSPSYSHRKLLDEGFCTPIDCIFYWAKKSQYPPTKGKPFFGHAYRVVWGVSDGKVVAIATDHWLWHHVK